MMLILKHHGCSLYDGLMLALMGTTDAHRQVQKVCTSYTCNIVSMVSICLYRKTTTRLSYSLMVHNPILCSHTSVVNSTGTQAQQALDSVLVPHCMPTILFHAVPMLGVLLVSALQHRHGAMLFIKSMRK